MCELSALRVKCSVSMAMMQAYKPRKSRYDPDCGPYSCEISANEEQTGLVAAIESKASPLQSQEHAQNPNQTRPTRSAKTRFKNAKVAGVFYRDKPYHLVDSYNFLYSARVQQMNQSDVSVQKQL